MWTVEAVEARNRLGEILDRVERGERVAITRNGRHIAMIAPPESEADGARETVERIRAHRETMRREGIAFTVRDILDARDEGRK